MWLFYKVDFNDWLLNTEAAVQGNNQAKSSFNTQAS